jgi:hypothetical protein
MLSLAGEPFPFGTPGYRAFLFGQAEMIVPLLRYYHSLFTLQFN